MLTLFGDSFTKIECGAPNITAALHQAVCVTLAFLASQVVLVRFFDRSQTETEMRRANKQKNRIKLNVRIVNESASTSESLL